MSKLMTGMEVSLLFGGEAKLRDSDCPQQPASVHQATLAVIVHAVLKRAAPVAQLVLDRVVRLMAESQPILRCRAELTRIAADDKRWERFQQKNGCGGQWIEMNIDDAVAGVETRLFHDTSPDEWKLRTNTIVRAGFAVKRTGALYGLIVDTETPLWSLTLLQHKNLTNVDVIVAYNHAVGDGTSAYALCNSVAEALSIALESEDSTRKLSYVSSTLPASVDDSIFGHHKPYPTAWFEWIVSRALDVVVPWLGRFAVKETIANLPPPSKIHAPFITSMVYSDAIDKERWTAILNKCREQNVKPQAFMHAVSALLTIATKVLWALPGAPPATEEIDLFQSVSIRRAARCDGPRPSVPTDEDVRVTMALTMDSIHATMSTDIWEIARLAQTSIDKVVKPSALRLQHVTVSGLLAANMAATPRRGMISGVFSPVNIGRYPFANQGQYAALTVTSMHIGESFLPHLGSVGGLLWLMELNGCVTWSMEYTKQFLSEEQAQRLLALFVETVDQAAAGQLTCAGALLRVLQESGDDKVLTATKAL